MKKKQDVYLSVTIIIVPRQANCVPFIELLCQLIAAAFYQSVKSHHFSQICTTLQ